MSWLPLDRERWPLAALFVSVATLVAVFILEYVFYQAPCQMCWWQRYVYFAACPVALAAIAFRWRGAGPTLMAVFCFALAAVFLVGAYISTWHALFEWDLAPGPTGCEALGGGVIPENQSLSDMLNRPMGIPSCKEALWRIPDAPWGLSMAGMNAILSVALAALSLFSATQLRQRTDTANEVIQP